MGYVQCVFSTFLNVNFSTFSNFTSDFVICDLKSQIRGEVIFSKIKYFHVLYFSSVARRPLVIFAAAAHHNNVQQKYSFLG